jgi:hypothetical protein
MVPFIHTHTHTHAHTHAHTHTHTHAHTPRGRGEVGAGAGFNFKKQTQNSLCIFKLKVHEFLSSHQILLFYFSCINGCHDDICSSPPGFGKEQIAQRVSSDHKFSSNCPLCSLKLIRYESCQGAAPAVPK